ncbi:hypothetical protein GCM10011316_23650 [Roseibium aquae]|uniref:HTH tetR-type domain-containing protein n=1 Tax=Roseibium aquae TaxID=1323746 RepID=A0A916X2J2_9HYPH|nr:TetR/AcrR family transcriptional regulator [Roseibium aquae]GGB50771.1 hypothetical protein GCM10011316_23650 [Roseibium aquae]
MSAPAPRKPQARTALTRARLLDAAKSIAREDGLEALTAEGIARLAGVAKGTLFAHFGDMDGLLSYLLLDRLQGLIEADGEASDDTLHDPVSAVVERMMALIGVMTESQIMTRMFMENIGVTKGHCAPEFAEQLARWDAKLLDVLKAWQASETAAPALRRDLAADVLLDGMIAFTLHGAILKQSCQVTDPDVLRERLRTHVGAYLLA